MPEIGNPRASVRLLLFFALILLPVHRAAFAGENEPGVWAVFSTTDSFSSDGGRWRYWLDTQARYFDIGSGINQWLVRPAVGYELNNGVRLWLGYGRFRTRGGSGAVFDENRVFQQVDWRYPEWNGGSLFFRARLLQRSVDIGDDTSLLLRTLARYSYPVSNDSRFVVSVEPFFDLRDTDWGGSSGFRQNRLFIGGGWDVGQHWYVEAGYMNQYLVNDNGSNISNHLGVLHFRYLR